MEELIQIENVIKIFVCSPWMIMDINVLNNQE